MSLTCTKPITSSIDALAEREARVAGGEHLGDRARRAGRSTSIQSMAWRGTMIERSGRSAKRMTPSRSSRSASWKTPASVPSAIIALTSSSVTATAPRRGGARRPSTASVERRRNQTIGRADRREHGHRAGDEGGDALGVPERQPLRHQLADDQRDVGGGDDDDGEGERAGDRGQGRHPAQHAGERLGEGGAGIGAGEDADERDADLHRGEKAVGSSASRSARPRRGCRPWPWSRAGPCGRRRWRARTWRRSRSARPAPARSRWKEASAPSQRPRRVHSIGEVSDGCTRVRGSGRGTLVDAATVRSRTAPSKTVTGQDCLVAALDRLKLADGPVP